MKNENRFTLLLIGIFLVLFSEGMMAYSALQKGAGFEAGIMYAGIVVLLSFLPKTM